MTKRKQEKEEVENAAPDNSHVDIISEISQESTLPKKKRYILYLYGLRRDKDRVFLCEAL